MIIHEKLGKAEWNMKNLVYKMFKLLSAECRHMVPFESGVYNDCGYDNSTISALPCQMECCPLLELKEEG